jgi:hypothetical protein
MNSAKTRHSDEAVLEGGDERLGDLGSGEGVHIVHDAILMDAVEEVHIRKAVVQRLAERNGLEDDEADDPGDQVEQALPFVKKLLGRGTPERGRFASFYKDISRTPHNSLDTFLSKKCHHRLAKKGHPSVGGRDAPCKTLLCGAARVNTARVRAAKSP